jgi:hypothetical protein
VSELSLKQYADIARQWADSACEMAGTGKDPDETQQTALVSIALSLSVLAQRFADPGFLDV